MNASFLSSRPYALVSVSDKTDLIPLAQGLTDGGYRILATGGTMQALQKAGISVESIEEYTGQQEILNGRVKTLHPKIHAGLLACVSNPQHCQELTLHNITPIAIAVVNLYPFISAIEQGEHDEKKLRELIDIGGPTMLRAAAKNSSSVLPVIDPADYPEVLRLISAGEKFSDLYRTKLAAKVFTATAAYDLAIAKFLTSSVEKKELTDNLTEPVVGDVLVRSQSLRYGENPHQQAAIYNLYNEKLSQKKLNPNYLSESENYSDKNPWYLLQGKPLSYNNILDLNATLLLMRAFPEDTHCNQCGVVIVKHLNPCGAALRPTLVSALEGAKQGDPRSHFGGIVGCTSIITKEVAEEITSDFAEVVVAPGIDINAREVFAKKKALRIVIAPSFRTLKIPKEIRQVVGGTLVQEPDDLYFERALEEVNLARCMTGKKPTSSILQSIALAWGICARVSSNAIVLVNNDMLIGVGAGQMSRIDSAELALSRARRHGHSTKGAIVASDAFFPFPDTVQVLSDAGVGTIIVPGGAKRDDEVISAASQAGVTLLFAEHRHFRH
jgi:phosphoribosylaminoimidazolecarboxamide formyltransferase/IMP cyclohydrolase